MSDLILVPTQREMDVLGPLIESSMPADCAMQICGFGPITSAARTATLIARYRAKRVLLIGIAGTFDEQKFPIGTACRFDEVVCRGIGVGSGEQHVSASSLGWAQFHDPEVQPKIDDRIELDTWLVEGVPPPGKLLTVCSASADFIQADRRRTATQNALAEDMEGFGVAAACAFARTPLQIVRGASNRVGDRDHVNWKVDTALQSAAELTLKLIPRSWMPSQS